MTTGKTIALTRPLLHSIYQQIWKTQQWSRDWKMSVLIPIPKKGNAKECSNYHTVALISHASKVMPQILQARFQQYMNREFPDVQAGFRKGRGTRDQIANIRWIIEKAREFQRNIYFCSIDYAKAFDCVDHNKLWKILKEMGIPDHLTFLLRNLYAGQDAIVRTRHGTTGWFQIPKGVRQAAYCHPAYLTSMQSTSWEMPGWMKHRLGLGLPGEISITSDMQMEKEMTTHSSVLAWRTPGMVEPGGLPSMGSHRVGHNWSNLAAAAVMQLTPPLWQKAKRN